MTKRQRIVRSDLKTRIALISLVAGMLAGCSNAVERFGQPVYTGGTDNQRAILGKSVKQPTYQDIMSGPGGTEAGLPVASSQPTYTGSVSRSPATIQRSNLPAPTRKAAPVPTRSQPIATIAAPETGARDAVTWKGWSSAGGTRVKVREGDTVASMSRRYGVPVEAIAKINGIEYPGQVKAGQTLIIPTYAHNSRSSSTRSASRNVPLTTGSINRSASVSSTTASPDRKPVRQPTFAEVRSGTISDAAPIRVAVAPKRKPVGPTGSVRKTTVASISGNVPVPPEMPARHRSTSTPTVSVVNVSKDQPSEARPNQPIQQNQKVASVQPSVDENTPRFRWPVRGRIISDFGMKAGGDRNDGINLAVPEGTPVKAADKGTVIYAGNELKGFGNLVLLRHADGWVTAYAHNSKLHVKRGDKVGRGDIIADAGATGSVSQPQVHFELRQGNKPIDPTRYLPQG